MSLAILVPVLNRPRNVKPLLDSIRGSTPEPYRVLFLCDDNDTAQHEAIDTQAGWRVSPGGSYSHKINVGVRLTSEPLLFLAADDVRPRPGWLQAGIDAMVDGIQVVGVNDCIPRPHRPEHATHFLMTRGYAEQPCIDGSPGPLHDGYDHSWVDDELIATASKRGVYVYAPGARVEHLHPMVDASLDDGTYRKGREHFRRDHKLFVRRSRLWT